MPDLKYVPISYLDEKLLLPLMEEEERSWMSDLDWDYSPVKQILVSFVRQKLLPGYAAVNEKQAVGYTYFLVNQARGIIGAIYVSRTSHSQEAVEELLSLTIASLKDSQNIKRVEAQILPFNNINLIATFTRNGFTYFPRYYLDLDINAYTKHSGLQPAERIVPWDSAYLPLMAEMTSMSYRNQTDSILCEDYRTRQGCESYLRSLVENPGCGIFLPEASFVVLDGQGAPCGFVISCRISYGAGMIPQIAVHPSYQGRGLGNALMSCAIEQFRSLGFRSASLTVTKKNRRAFDWYQRLGFKFRKDFGAYIWER
jgi:ribosomal protein S18 acetylase RimI-like enzyme